MKEFFELLSALQKDIRRGKEYEALHWAMRLESMNQKALWNRLKIIASEDIGYKNPNLPIIIETLEKQYAEAWNRKDKHGASRVFLSNAIIIMCRSEKSRVTDDLLNVVYGEIQHEGKKLDIPAYAKDVHTYEGKAKGSGIEEFFDEGSKLSNEDSENPYTQRAKKILTKYRKLKTPDYSKKYNLKEEE